MSASLFLKNNLKIIINKFFMEPKWQSSRRKFSHIWLSIRYESTFWKKYLSIILSYPAGTYHKIPAIWNK